MCKKKISSKDEYKRTPFDADVELTGSEKQIAWAKDIIKEKIEILNNVMEAEGMPEDPKEFDRQRFKSNRVWYDPVDLGSSGDMPQEIFPEGFFKEAVLTEKEGVKYLSKKFPNDIDPKTGEKPTELRGYSYKALLALNVYEARKISDAVKKYKVEIQKNIKAQKSAKWWIERREQQYWTGVDWGDKK